ncbi:MAG: hypothetical protein JXR18_14105 [Neptuniibacter sp.]
MYYRIPTGGLGEGKSLVSVYLATRYLKRGLYVVTNVDFYPEHFRDKHSKSIRIIRLPDHPNEEHFKCLPVGNPTLELMPDGTYGPGPNFDPKKNSLLLLDELVQFLNSRDYNKKGRRSIISVVVMLRKMGYDTIFIAQAYDMIDSQVRKAVGNEVGEGMNMSMLPIPLIGWLGRYINSDGEPFRFPSSMIRYNFYRVKRDNVSNLKTATYSININDYKRLYNTAQLFSADYQPPWAVKHWGEPGPHSLLTPYHLIGYKLPKPLAFLKRFERFICSIPFYAALLFIPFTSKSFWEFSR